MAVNVLVVDDSGFFRRRVTELLNSHADIKVIGTATNGKEAIQQAQELKPDIITMDYEMPVMDGITAVKEILKTQKVPILMFSSLTHEGARVTLDALEAGAVDYLPKNFEDISKSSSKLQNILHQRILTLAKSKPDAAVAEAPAPEQKAVKKAEATPSARRKSYNLIAIGTSTGGPMALQQVLSQIPADFPVPLVVVQHMPATFTAAFAERLNRLCRIKVKEATDGEALSSGVALLAPGGKQMILDSRGGNGGGGAVRILAGDNRLNYKPSVDVTFGSAAKSFGSGVLGIVLTGMGADGREGARMLKTKGSKIWTQDENSCVIYGMPMAVDKADLSDDSIGLAQIGPRLVEEAG